MSDPMTKGVEESVNVIARSQGAGDLSLFSNTSPRSGIAVLLAITTTSLGCTSLGYASGGKVHQVRQGEAFEITIKDEKPEDLEFALAGPGAILAAAALEGVVKFASTELQNHLERVAALHEAQYTATAVKAIEAGRDYSIVLSRKAQKGPENDPSEGKQEVMHAEYKLESQRVDNNCVLVLRPVSISTTHAAARLASAKDPFNLDLQFTFFTVAKEGTEKESSVKRTQLGDPLTHSLLVGLTSKIEKPSFRAESADTALGVIVLPMSDSSKQHLLGMTVAVTERDPSKAADRNKRTAEALKELTPLLVDYAKDKAGVADEKE